MKNERSIMGNIKFMIDGLAQAIGTTTNAINEIAKTGEALAATGTTMAVNNKELVELESNHNKRVKLAELEKEFADFDKE